MTDAEAPKRPKPIAYSLEANQPKMHLFFPGEACTYMDHLEAKCEQLEESRAHWKTLCVISDGQTKEWRELAEAERSKCERLEQENAVLRLDAARLEKQREALAEGLESKRKSVVIAPDYDTPHLTAALMGQELEKLKADNVELRQQVERFTALTADDVRVGPGDEVWSLRTAPDEPALYPVIWNRTLRRPMVEDARASLVSDCYSTRAAAEAAAKEGA